MTAAAAAAKLLQSCPTLCDPIDGSPLGSSVPGTLQARILEWVAISFSNAWKWKVKVKSLSRARLLVDPMDCSIPGSSTHGIFQTRVLEWVAIAFSDSNDYLLFISIYLLAIKSGFQFSSVAQSCLTPYKLMDCFMPDFPVHHQLPELAQTHVHWVADPTISFSVIPFSSCFQSFPASGSFPMSQLFTSSGQSIGVSASASALSMNIQDWFHLGLTGLISLQSKGLSRVFSNTTVQKHQFFSTQLSSQSNSHIHTWLLEKP